MQFGFRSKSQQEHGAKKKLILVFIDLVKAFDSVNKTALFTALRSRKLGNPLSRIIWQLHAQAECVLDKQNKFVLERSETWVPNQPLSSI